MSTRHPIQLYGLKSLLLLALLVAGAAPVGGNPQGAPVLAMPQLEAMVYLPLIRDSAAPPGAPVIASFTADPATVAVGNQSILRWDVTGATSLSILPTLGPVSGTYAQINPTMTTEYMLTATSEHGSATAATIVTVTGNSDDSEANFFLPYQPDGSIITTGLPKVAVDAAGGVHVAYAGYMPEESSGLRRAYYGYCSGECTNADSFTLVSMGTLLDHAQLALTAAGQPRLLLTWQDIDYVDHYHYAECNTNCTDPAQWSLGEAAAGRSTGSETIEHDHSFALDAQGRPRFVYMADGFGVDPSEAGTFYVTCDDDCTNTANWVRTKLTDYLWDNPALAFTPDADSRPRIALGMSDTTGAYGWFGYFECNADCTTPDNWTGVWLARTDPYWYHTGAIYALRITSNGQPRIAIQPWQGYSDLLNLGQLSYLACDANCTQYESWTAVDLGLPQMDGDGGVDLALDGQNRPHIAYRIPGVTMELAYAWCKSNCEASAQDWQTQMIPTTAQAQEEWPFDPMQGCPSPTCIPPIPGCTDAFWDAGNWPSLALDPGGNPRIVFDLKSHHTGGGCDGWSFVRWSRFVSFDQP